MSTQELLTSTPEGADSTGVTEHIAPAPRISVQAFCEAVETAAVVHAAGEDRRLGKAHLKVQMGGITGAVEAYSTAPTPNVIVIESESRGDDLLDGLDSLAAVCDAGTRVVVIGRHNDIALYRELIRRGVSEYVIGPVSAIDVVRSICGLFTAPDATPVGHIIAVIGAKGGVGASTIAHNMAWAVARDLKLDTVVADLDLGFGTAGLDYNQDPSQGIADAVFSPDRVDTGFMERLLSKCTDHLSLLAAPATLDRVYDFPAESFDGIYDALRATVPCIVLDVPHQWTGWTRRALAGADEILVVAGPDLANLRNTKNLLDLLRAARPNDRRPYYCLNQVGAPKRPEISRDDFAKGLDDQPIAVIPFEPQLFGTAANNGQMIAEVASSHRAADAFRAMAHLLTGRSGEKKSRSGLLLPLLDKFLKRSRGPQKRVKAA
jgi:pilus assembly protein CpaE